MSHPRFQGGQRKGLTQTASLDELVAEDDVTDRNIRNKNSKISDDEEEDELEAYMATIENESNRQIKKLKADNSESPRDEDEEDLEAQAALVEPDVEDLRADVEAAKAGLNTSANRMTKKLNQLMGRVIQYAPFKKDFYQEVPELAKLTKEEVDEMRIALENIKVSGKSCPKPVVCWAHCGLSKKIMDVLKKSNYLSPTPIQAQAIPAIMSGRDVIGIANTGCGKTLSFLLPMFRHILAQPRLEKGDGPIAVVITPTRELALQICDVAQKFAKVLAQRVVAIYGGVNIREHIALLKPGAEVIVCTPGRMIEILTVNNGGVTNLNRCTYLVMDEADRLFDMGFEKQIRSIVDLIRPDRQTVMFSATFPTKLESHARKILTNPIAIQVGGRSVVCKDVSQTVEIIEEHDKFPRLIELLQRHVDNESSALVFVYKQEKADSLLEDLMQAYSPNCLVLHGGIDKDDRTSTFASFKKGHTKVLVATSVAARGLDVKNCICVVNYDCPNHYEDYVHRCGRTGRAGNKGFAYTFITPDQGNHAADIIKALELSENPVPGDLQKLWDDYKTEAEKSGRKIWTSSGFSGRGFKFDEAETQLVNERKKYQKKSLGMQNSSDEEEEAGDVADAEVDTATLENEIKNLAGGKNHAPKSSIKCIGSKATKSDANKHPGAESAGNNKTTGSLSKLELVKQRAAMLGMKKGIEVSINPQTTAGVSTSGIGSASQSDQTKTKTGLPRPVESVKSGEVIEIPMGAPSNSSGNERYEMQLEINDYHQQVRRRLTSKEALAKVSEHCEVGITVRGKYCHPGDRPTEPKLYLAFEGNTQASVEKAHRELLLLVKDEYNRINSQPASRGRYRIV